MTNLAQRFVILSAVLFALIGCEGGMKGMSDQELSSKNDACIKNNPSSPGKVTACENIRKECERRRKEGNFAC